MPMRNRRVRLLLLAVILTVTFLLYSRSDPTTIQEAKQYAQRTYQYTYDQTIGKSNKQGAGDVPAVEIKKDEPFRVDFDAYSKAAADAAGDTGNGNIPPPAQPVPQPPEVKTTAPAPAETKQDDPMRVDFAAYSKAAGTDPEETTAAVPGSKNEVIANPNPIVGVVGARETTTTAAVAPTTTTAIAKQANIDTSKPINVNDNIAAIGEGRMEIDVDAITGDAVHWSKFAEKFAPSTTAMFPFNSGTPIPKIQHEFKNAPGAGADKEKLAAIKAAASHSWQGYRTKAMGHDEVKPVSGLYANPFNAWGATLVDSLDTLWLMGMFTEFEEALEWVAKIDFTTSKRSDIPVFETTIRYMGGLLGAYEISSRKFQVLLDQAAQLGEILYGAFDTPNRMPMTYYHWKPAFASQGHIASIHTIMAELGSLSLEFTRLGQLVGQAKYYDAVARITDALEEWQPKTRLPGLWPTTLDASGCKKLPSSDEDEMKFSKSKGPMDTKLDTKLDPKPASSDSKVSKPGKEPGIGKIAGFGNPLDEGSLDSPSSKASVLQDTGITKLVKRALDSFDLKETTDKVIDTAKSSLNSLSNSALSGLDKGDTTTSKGDTTTTSKTALSDAEDCIPQGLASTSEYSSEVFTLGAAADSTYEYLPKMHLLLGGRVDQYQRMFKKASDASKKSLLFRAMIPDEKRQIMFAGNVDVSIDTDGKPKKKFSAVSSHLACFVGGMFAMSGKIFDNPEDVEIGAKLTDGCVWAYNSTTTGIMPELLGLYECKDAKNCKWDQAAYHKALDPYEETRLGAPEKTKIPDPRAILQGASKSAPGKVNLEKRQFGGGEMQYGVQTGPDILPGAAATIVAEVPPLGMGNHGMPSALLQEDASIKMPYDAGAAQKLPALDTVPNAGAKNADMYPTGPDALAKSSTDSKPQEKAPTQAQDKTPIQGTKDRIPPAVPDTKIAPTSPETQKLTSNKDTKIAPATPDTGLAPTVPDTPVKIGGGTAADSKLPDVGYESKSNSELKDQSRNRYSNAQDTPLQKPMSHEEFVKDKIQMERLPAGMVDMYDKRYILRPEAIESVFYMYRITGNQYWRDRGWEMWNAVSKYTHATYGATAIDDVSKSVPVPADSEESFWLAETLKYYYLLFDDPDRYSLDDWVLNTEAHFLARLGA